MLEFYRKHYIGKNNFINSLDIVLAIVFTFIGYKSIQENELPILWIIVVTLLWVKAILTTFCMIKYQKEKEVE